MDAPGAMRGAVVLTTHERSGYFTSVLGDDIDLRFDPQQGGALHDVLHNVVVAGGKLVILDEAFFIDVDEMALGLERFFTHEKDPKRLRFIVVCTRRGKGDLLLAFLVMYCGIYNIIYGKSGIDLSIELSRLIERDNTRADVIDLVQDLGWGCAKQYGSLRFAEEAPAGTHAATRDDGETADPVMLDQVIELGDKRVLNLHIELLTDEEG